MRRFWLTSCASSLVMALLVGESALAQQTVTLPGATPTNVDSAQITDGANNSPTQLQVNGGGSAQLTNTSNSYSGGTAVTGNTTLIVDDNRELGKSSGSLTLGDSGSAGTLQLNNSTSNSFVSGRSIILNSGGGTINGSGGGTNNQASSYFSGTISGAGGLTISGGHVNLFDPSTLLGGINSYLGGTTINNGATLLVTSNAQLGDLGGAINLGDSTNAGGLAVQGNVSNFVSARSININAGGGVLFGPSGGNVATYSGVVGGTGLLTVAGPGTVFLANTANSWTGGTAVLQGATLQITNESALGNVVASSVQLGDTTTHGTLQFVAGAGAANSTTRQIALGIGGGTISNTSGYSVTLSGSIIDLTTNSIGGPIYGGGLTISGTSPVVLSGANLYTGNTTVNAGAILSINSDNALGGYSIFTNTVTGQTSYSLVTTPNSLILNGGTLQLNAASTIRHPITLGTGGGTIDTDGNASTITTTISGGSNGLNVVNTSTSSNGNLILDGVNSYTGMTNVSGGSAFTTTLTIGDSATSTAKVNGNVTVQAGGVVAGSGTIAGTLFNQGGTVAPAEILRATSYSQSSGSLSPVIGPTSVSVGGGAVASGELAVSGNATINGGYLTPTFATGFLRAGTYVIFSASSLTGTGFTEQAVSVPSIGLSGQIVQVGNQYEVVLTQLPSLPGYDRPVILPVLTGAAVDEAHQAIGSLLDHIAGVRTNALADELSAALTDSHRVRGTSPYGLWVMPLGNTGTVNGSNGVAGYNVQGGGLMAGIETEWMPSVVIGMSLGYTSNFVKQSDTSGSGTISMPRLNIYGGWWRGPFAIDATIGLGMGKIDSTRPVLTPSIYETAYASHVANEKSAALQASAAFSFDGWVVGPALGVKYLNLRQTGFTETGTDIYNFAAANNNVNSLRPYGNVLFSKRFMVGDHWALVPELKAGLEHELNNSPRKVVVQTQGDDFNWVYNGLLNGADLLRLDGGLKLETSRAAAFFVDYNHLQSSSTTNEYISGGFRYRL